MLYIMNLILYFNLYHLASAIACLAKFHAGTFRTCPHGLSGYLLHGCRWRATSAHIPLSLHHWRQLPSRDGWRLIDTKVQAPHILFFGQKLQLFPNSFKNITHFLVKQFWLSHLCSHGGSYFSKLINGQICFDFFSNNGSRKLLRYFPIFLQNALVLHFI